ncbi:MAG: transketolase C-terminal domain-containing protein [bacterium]|nr:transketolase C-terminal domain-containing protein [bacterium]
MVDRQLTYVQAIADGLVQAMEDPRVLLMGEGVDNITGIYGTILPSFKRFGPQRVIDTPLSENGLTGIAIGAAMDGLRPVLFHQRNDFMLLTMDQLVNNAAKFRYISAGVHKVPLTVVSFIARKPGEGAQHSQSLQSLFAHIPGLKVVMPATPYDAKGLLLSAIADDDPVIVLYHRALFEQKDHVPEELYEIPLGQARVAWVGSDITIVAVSAVLQNALEVAEQLENEVSVEVIDLCSIRPLDSRVILESVAKTRRLIVADTGWRSFGVSAEVIALVCENLYLDRKPQRIALPEVPAPATPYLLKNYHPSTEQIIEEVRAMMA